MSRVPHVDPGPLPEEELERFLGSYYYEPEAFLIDEVRRIERHEVEAAMDTARRLPFADRQRGDPQLHRRHVSWPEMVMLSGSLGSLHAYFVHGCRWDLGWVGYANRIHRADVKRLARRGPPLALHLLELRSRLGERRLVSRYRFTFEQEGRVVYRAEQTTQYLRTSKGQGPADAAGTGREGMG